MGTNGLGEGQREGDSLWPSAWGAPPGGRAALGPWSQARVPSGSPLMCGHWLIWERLFPVIVESNRIWGGIGQRRPDRQRSQTRLGLGLCRTRGPRAGAPLPLPLGSRATHAEVSMPGSGLPSAASPLFLPLPHPHSLPGSVLMHLQGSRSGGLIGFIPGSGEWRLQ